jgi:hypothetical protein
MSLFFQLQHRMNEKLLMETWIILGVQNFKITNLLFIMNYSAAV